MNSDIITYIKEDHKKLKYLYKAGLDEDSTLEEKKSIFRQLVTIILAHSKSEEAVIYAQTCRDLQTKKDAYEGFEEHALVELLIEEIKSEQNDDKWEAKFTVVCELLDRHIRDEEENYLPKLKSILSDEQRNEMAVEYRDMFERLIKAQKSISEPQYPDHLRNH